MSGARSAARRWRRIAGLARAAFPGLEVHESRGPGELTRIARSLADSDETMVVIAAGGDGTSHEVINGLVPPSGARPGGARMGWLPLGSGNDLARALGVPNVSRRALEAYRDPVPDRIDVGTVRYRDQDGRETALTFGNSLSFGVSADVLDRVRRTGKRLGGTLSYLAATVHALARHRRLPVALSVDGEPGQNTACRLVVISNGPRLGAGMRIAPMAQLADGRLDLLWVAGISRLATLALFPRVYLAAHLGHPAVRHRAFQRLSVEAATPLPFEADGELYAGRPPFVIAVEPGRLPIVRVADAKARSPS